MKKLSIFLILILFTTCTSKSIIKSPENNRVAISKNRLEKFFNRCISDINMARNVIINQDLIKILTHLQGMDANGKKYYTLENESISKMINSVTKGIYSDFILINNSGRIIYTNKNDEIFGKDIHSDLQKTALSRCFLNRNKNIYFEDVTSLSPLPYDYLFISAPIKSKNSFPGVLVLQINTSLVKELLAKKTDIIGNDGTYRISHTNKSFTQYKYFNKLNLQHSDMKNNSHFSISNTADIVYQPFKYKNIYWIVISERKRQ